MPIETTYPAPIQGPDEGFTGWLLMRRPEPQPAPTTRTLRGAPSQVFTGIGAAGAVLFGILLRGDPPTLGRLLPIATIVIGIVLLRFFAERDSRHSPRRVPPLVAAAGHVGPGHDAVQQVVGGRRSRCSTGRLLKGSRARPVYARALHYAADQGSGRDPRASPRRSAGHRWRGRSLRALVARGCLSCGV